MSFITYDLWFLGLFIVFLAVFLYIKRANVKREGIIFLYRTKLGMKIMDNLGKKHQKLLKVFSYPIVAVGYFLMVVMVYLLIEVTYYYVKFPEISRAIKAPPIVPLIPYFPKLFGLESYFPEFYFIHFLVAIALVAIFHEGFHGIYMRLHNVKIKSTGFLFLGPLLGFFVEQDDKQLKNKKIFPQLTILSSGVFANVLLSLIFFIVLIGFFNSVFSPNGVVFSGYSSALIPATYFGNLTFGNSQEINGIDYTNVKLENLSFFSSNISLEQDYMLAYYDLPAFRNGLRGAIININGADINDFNDLSKELGKYNPQDNITLQTTFNNTVTEYNIILGGGEISDGRAILGVGIGGEAPEGVRGWISKLIKLTKDPSVYYETRINMDLAEFIYYFLGWIVIINLLVAFANMIPVGIFDGGRFWYLTVLAITKNKKIAEKAFKASTWFILLLVAILMIVWLFNRF